jgi:hypothetical protein
MGGELIDREKERKKKNGGRIGLGRIDSSFLESETRADQVHRLVLDQHTS